MGARLRRFARRYGLGVAVAACGCTPAGVGPGSANVSATGLPPAPPPAPRGLPMPELSVDWAPPIISAGDVGALADALGRHSDVQVAVGPRLDGSAARDRLQKMVATLSPDTKVEVAAGALAKLVPGDLPIARVEGSQGRPRYAKDGVVADLSRWRGDDSDKAPVLALDDAKLDADAWRRQPASSVGTCQPALAALGAGQEQSLAVLEPFLDHADAVLDQLYRQELAERLGPVRSNLAAFEADEKRADFADDDAFSRHECGRAFLEYVDEIATCRDAGGTCAYAPRMYLVGNVRIGSAEPAVIVPDSCAELLGDDPVASVRGIGRDVVRTTVEVLDTEWSALADRVAALTEVEAAMDDLCTPRRRRFSDRDLGEARSRLSRIGDHFRQPQSLGPDAKWVIHEDEFRVAGIGRVHQLAQFDGGDESGAARVVQDARSLREFVIGRSHCGGSTGRLPLAAVLVGADGSSVDFLGYFYEEELLCAELPPLLDQ